LDHFRIADHLGVIAWRPEMPGAGSYRNSRSSRKKALADIDAKAGDIAPPKFFTRLVQLHQIAVCLERERARATDYKWCGTFFAVPVGAGAARRVGFVSVVPWIFVEGAVAANVGRL